MMRRLVAQIDEAGGPEIVCEMIADGVRIGRVAEHWGVSRRMLYMWRDKMDRERGGVKDMWAEAVRLSAEADVERSLEDFDRLDRVVEVRTDEEGNVRVVNRIPTAAEVSLVTGRAKFNQWLAARKDPDRFGDKAQVDINHNLGDLHLEALKQMKQLRRPTVEAETDETTEAEEADYEIADD